MSEKTLKQRIYDRLVKEHRPLSNREFLQETIEWLQQKFDNARGNDLQLIMNKNTFRSIVKAVYIELLEELKKIE